jgi:hypothetical protein
VTGLVFGWSGWLKGGSGGLVRFELVAPGLGGAEQVAHTGAVLLRAWPWVVWVPHATQESAEIPDHRARAGSAVASRYMYSAPRLKLLGLGRQPVSSVGRWAGVWGRVPDGAWGGARASTAYVRMRMRYAYRPVRSVGSADSDTVARRTRYTQTANSTGNL